MSFRRVRVAHLCARERYAKKVKYIRSSPTKASAAPLYVRVIVAAPRYVVDLTPLPCLSFAISCRIKYNYNSIRH